MKKLWAVLLLGEALSVPALGQATGSVGLDPGFVQLMGGFGEPSLGERIAFERENSAVAASQTSARDHAPGVVFYRFPDGSRLAVKRSTSKAGMATVRVLVGQGRLGLPDRLARSSWTVPFLAAAGTGSASLKEIEQWLGSSGHSARFNLLPRASAFAFEGEGAVADLGYQLGAICGVARNALVTDELAGKLRQFGAELPTQVDARPGLVFARAVQRAGTGLGARYSEFPLRSEISSDPAGDLSGISAFLSGPFDIAVVGDVDPDQVMRSVGETCAAGTSSRPSRVPPRAVLAFRAGVQRDSFPVTTVAPAGSLIGVFWPTADLITGQRDAVSLDLLGNILQVRLSVKFSRQGKRVVPSVGVASRDELPLGGYFGVGIDGSALGPASLRAVLDRELLAMEVDPALAGELSAVRGAALRDWQKQAQSNAVLADVLALSLAQPDVRDRFETRPAMLRSIEPGEVRSMARKLRLQSVYSRVVVSPRSRK